MGHGRRVAILLALGVTLAAAATAVAALAGSMKSAEAAVTDLGWVATFAAFAAVGAVILRARPRHPVGWMFLGAGTLGMLSNATAAVALASVGSGEAFGDVAGWLTTWVWSLPIGLLVWSITLFPTGRPVGKVSGWIGPVASTIAVVLAGINMVSLWPLRSPELALMVEFPDTPAGRVGNVLVPILMGCAVGAMVSIVVRFHGALGVERQQLKWGALGAAVMAPALLVSEVLQPHGVAAMILEVLSLPLWLVIAAGVAITRHRLYDIDRLISRTVSYALLTAVLGGAYVGTVMLTTTVLPRQSDDLMVAVSTLLVAGLFRSARARIQSAVARRFNRSRYDAEGTIRGFAEHVRDEVDLPVLAGDVRRTVIDALQPSLVAVWLHPPSPGQPAR